MRERSRTTPRVEPSWLRSVIAVWALVIIGAWFGAQLGIADALNSVVRRWYYAERGTRPGGARVLFVAIDETTARDWGSPPWPWSRYQALIDRILDGQPRLVAVLEPGPKVLQDGAVPTELGAAVAAGRLVLPPAEIGFHQPAVVLEPRGVVEAIDLGNPDATDRGSITHDVLQRLGYPARGHLTVNFIGSPDALPTLLAHYVARGEVPASTFTDRVVVIGLRGEAFTNEVPTPVGRMAPTAVHAHALHAVVTHATWREPNTALVVLLVAGFAALGIVVPRRARSPYRAGAVLAGAAAIVVVAAYLLFARAYILFPVGESFVALVLAGTCGLLLERNDTLRGLTKMHNQVTERLVQAVGARPGVTAEMIQDRFAEALRTHLEVVSCAWAELPPGAWHLQIKRWYGEATTEQIHERRRDVRRDPWRLPYGSHRPEWSNRLFMQESLELDTLLLPVSSFGRLLGFWIVNVPMTFIVSETQLQAIQALCDDAAYALDELRIERALGDERRDYLPGALPDAVRAANHETLALARMQNRTHAALERLPVGVLTATSWGHVESCNQAMKRFLDAAGVDNPHTIGVNAMLARVTNVPEAAARTVIRELFVTGTPLRLEARVGAPGGPPQVYELVLSRSQTDDGPASLVLAVSERHERPLMALDWRWTGGGVGTRNVVDVAALLRDTLATLTANGTWTIPPAIELRATSAVVLARGDELAQAMLAMLSSASGPDASSARVLLEDSDHEIKISIAQPAVSIPYGDLAALGSEKPDHLSPQLAHLVPLARARADIESNRGRVEFTSTLANGTTIAIFLPKPGAAGND